MQIQKAEERFVLACGSRLTICPYRLESRRVACRGEKSYPHCIANTHVRNTYSLKGEETYRVMTSFSSNNLATFSTSPLRSVRSCFVRWCAILLCKGKIPQRAMMEPWKNVRDHLPNFKIQHLARLLAERLLPAL